jgi:hypothetical protein
MGQTTCGCEKEVFFSPSLPHLSLELILGCIGHGESFDGFGDSFGHVLARKSTTWETEAIFGGAAHKSHKTSADCRYWNSVEPRRRVNHLWHRLEGAISARELIKVATCDQQLSSWIFQPETANQLKFNFFPDIWADYEKDFLWDIKQQPFPNGRRRREILTDKLTGQTYESYNVSVVEVGDEPLAESDSESPVADDVDEFDDQFEEDLLDKQALEDFYLSQSAEPADEKTDDFDLSSSRWVAYDALSSTLERFGRRFLVFFCEENSY